MNLRPHLPALLCLWLLPLLWLWPFATGERRFVPFDAAEFPPSSLLLTDAAHQELRAGTNHDVTELPAWFLPEFELAGRELRAGNWPGWNPHARSGAPIHGHGLLGLCYPPNWLALASDDPGGRLWLLAWLSLGVAAFGAYGLFTEVGLSRLAAWFGAASFQLAAPMAANAFFWMRLGSLVWLPALLWALLRIATAELLRPGAACAAALAFAMPWLAGFPPFAATTTIFAGLYILWLALQRGLRDGPRAGAGIAMRCALPLLPGALLALPQVLPSLLFFADSARVTDPSLAHIALSRFDRYGLLGYLLPDLIGHPTADVELPYGKSPIALWLCDRVAADGKGALPNYNYTEYAVHFGLLGLVLALYGALVGRDRRRGFPALAFLLALALALFWPVARWLYHLPLFANVWPMRWLAPATLLACWLAAIGLDRLLAGWRLHLVRAGAVVLAFGYLARLFARWPAERADDDPQWWLAAIAERVGVTPDVVRSYVQDGAPAGLDRFAAAATRASAAGDTLMLWSLLLGGGLWLAAVLRPTRWFRPALGATLGTALLQLVLHGAPLLAGIRGSVPTETPVHTFLRDAARARAAEGGFTVARASRGEMLQIQLPPGQLLSPGLRDLQFYSHFDRRSLAPLAHLLPADVAARHTKKGYLTTSLPAAIPGLFAHPYLDLCGVRYLLAIQALPELGPPVGPRFVGPRGEFFVYERKDALPRAFAVPRLVTVADDDAVLARLADPTLDPRAQAFAVADPADPAGPVSPANRENPGIPATPARAVRFVADRPTTIELAVDAGPAPWLVLADTWLAGWTATVDGAPTPIHRVNHWMRGVALPERACTVVFHYSPPGWLAGRLAAGLGILLLAAGWWHDRRRRPA